MITLAEAFKLCEIGEETVFLRHVDEPKNIWDSGHRFWSKKIRDKFDMRKIRVVNIELEFEHFGPEFRGWRFVVAGITPEELYRIEYEN